MGNTTYTDAEIALLSCYRGRKMTDSAVRQTTGLDQNTLLKAANSIRERFATPGTPAHTVDLREVARKLFSATAN